MKRNSILIAVGVFLLPVLIRGIYFYHGWYRAPSTLAAPSYTELTMPIPPASSETMHDKVVDAQGRIVLIDRAHDNRFELSELDLLLGDLTARGVSIEFTQDSYDPGELPLSERLKYANAYIVITPMKAINTSTAQQVSRFASRGGRLLVISDPTRNVSDYYGEYSDIFFVEAIAANSLLAPFDISFANDFLYNLVENEANYRNVLFHQFAEDAVTEGLSEVVFYGAGSIQTNTGTSLIVGDDNTRSSRDGTTSELTASVRSADGGVIAIGDLSFLTAPYSQVADNQRFISNLIDFLLSGERAVDLTDYPYIFRDSVTLLATDSFDLTTDTVESIAAMQSAFNARGQTLTLSDKPQKGSDLIILSPFSPDDSVKEILESVEGLTLPDIYTEVLSVAPFGEMDPSGLGAIFLDRTEERTTLFLFAETIEDLLEFATFLEGDSIQNCVVRENAGVCKAGSGMDFDFGFDEYDFDFDDALLEDEGMFTPTETAEP